LATKNPSVGVAFTRIASLAPMAKAFLKVGSVSGPPTFTTVTVAPCCSWNQIARVNPNSSFANYILNTVCVKFRITVNKVNFLM
jgi:hypothetical protein